MSQSMTLICYIVAVFFTWQSSDDLTAQQAIGIYLLGGYALMGISHLLTNHHRDNVINHY
ncbi:hypothetical protein [Veronia pacifica]|uniref:Uncharacterized protein n=1 Tax=Veronia pacifica TaxID=1080227 RepID=A0A1C3ESV3_9GAMM|nr:hypothetical protein [Veronia pacifica]ODA36265.1 hypothetical protein A8L45_01305 [Veronia pacifica]